MLKRQQFSPGPVTPYNVLRLSEWGRNTSNTDADTASLGDNSGDKSSVHCHDLFTLHVAEYTLAEESVYNTYQEHYIKFNFLLSRPKSMTVLDGFGEYDHNGPEIFITAGPQDMRKIDLNPKGVYRNVALCVPQAFFSDYLELEPAALPAELRVLAGSKEFPFTVRRLSLSPAIAAAAQSLHWTPPCTRQNPLYIKAKVTELMYLLMGQMDNDAQAKRTPPMTARRMEGVHHAQELLTQRYAEHWTLERLAKEAGLSKTALTQGFRQLFGLSVFEFLLQCRMQRAYELLQYKCCSMLDIAQAVGYEHHCNFSTAFRQYYGISPKQL